MRDDRESIPGVPCFVVYFERRLAMKKMTGSMLAAAFLVSGLLAACEEPREGPMEKVGKNVDEATEDAGEAIEEAGEEMEDAAD